MANKIRLGFVGAKCLDLLRQILPGMRRVGLLYDLDNLADKLSLEWFESGCEKLALKSLRAPVRKAEEIAIERATAFEFCINLKTAKSLGVNIPPTPMQRTDRLIE